LRGMGINGLRAFLPKVKDPVAIKEIEQMIDDLIIPAAAGIKDDRTKVLPAQLGMYNELSTYLQGLPARLEALVKAPAPGNEWIQNNPNVQQVLTIVSQLANNFASQKHIVRFDPALLTGTTAASYDHASDLISLRPATGTDPIARVAKDLVHEFTHHLQDVAAEDAVMLDKTKKEDGRKEGLAREVEARKTGVYASSLVQMLGDARDTTAESLSFNGPMMNDRLYTAKFETLRNAKTSTEKAEATKNVEDPISKAYEASGQFAANHPHATYYAELGKYDNHIRINLDKGPVDLGEVPADIKTEAALEHHLRTKIEAAPNQHGVFDKTEGKTVTKYAVITILVFYQGKKLSDFAMRP
jgi:hypothetical protein